jgi:hypothetical protein
MRTLALTLLVVAVALSARTPTAVGATVALPASADVGMPFWCDWGYDWDERCYRDDGPRLPVGGVDDKVWRSAIRFPLGQIPAGASVAAAELRLWYDGVCVGPRKTTRACGRSYAIDVRRILSSDWRDEREVELDEVIEAGTTVLMGSAPHWLGWDVTGLVERWHKGDVPNNGLLLGLAVDEEDLDVSGPYLPSMSYPDATRRPRLVVTFS